MNKNKVIVLIVFICVWILVNTYTPVHSHASQCDEEITESYDIAKSLLSETGLWENTNEDNQYIQRWEVAKFVCDFCEVGYGDGKYPEVDDLYADVSPEYFAYEWIYYAKIITCDPFLNRPMNGYENGCFYPENNITYGEFIKVAVSLLGWCSYVWCETDREFPDDFCRVADMLKINHDINYSSQQYITRKDAMQIIFNVIRVPRLTFSNISSANNFGYKFEQRSSYLEGKKNIYEVTGYAELLNDNNILIDGNVCVNTNEAISVDGKYVLCFYRKSGDVNESVICFPVEPYSRYALPAPDAELPVSFIG